MRLPENVMLIIERLGARGYRADVVGGPVRDFLLGKTPSDFDLTTDALPEQIKAAFSDLRTVDTGIKHGTVSVIIGGEQYEITTYRIDGEYTDSRHPDSVTFTPNITEDLRRRDFTMNAIAYNPRAGITDPFGGREDVARGVIRAVGEPRLRFTEDALRILRGVRFRATLGFSVEEATADAMRELSPRLSMVSAERIYTEWRKLLSGADAYSAITEFSSVIEVFLPELSGLKMPSASRFDAATPAARMLSLFLSSGLDKPSAALDFAMRRLKTDTESRRLGVTALALLEKYPDLGAVGAQRLLSESTPDAARLAASAATVVGRATAEDSERIERAIADGVPYLISHLRISGDGLIALGYSGRSVGTVLRRLLDMVIDGELENDERALTDAARGMLPSAT